MHRPAEAVSLALGMYYEGMSLNAIRRQLQETHGLYPSDSTIFRWVSRFTDDAIRLTKDIHPKVGDVWVSDETVISIPNEPHRVWLHDVIDAETRVVLASRLVRSRTKRGVQLVMEEAKRRAGKSPKVVLTDQLAVYPDGIDDAFGSESKHVPTSPFNEGVNTNLVERWHSTLKQRTKVMRGLKGFESAKRFLEGWIVHYNYFREHSGIGDKTPMLRAGVTEGIQSWTDVVKSHQPKPKATRITPDKAMPRDTRIPITRRHGFVTPRKPRLPR